jgi:hypothetical protein
MFSKDNPGDNTYEKDGQTYYYFDRNPEIFRIVVNFYRSGTYNIMIKPENCTYKNVADELDFWCIPEEACASADVRKAAGILYNCLMQCARPYLPLIISDQMFYDNQYWSEGNTPKTIGVADIMADTDITHKMLGDMMVYTYPKYHMINALRRKGMNVAIEFTEFKCGNTCKRILYTSNFKSFIVYIRACCNRECFYENNSGLLSIRTAQRGINNACGRATEPLLTVKMID